MQTPWSEVKTMRVLLYTAVFQSLDDASHMFVYSGDAGVVVADVFAEVVAFRGSLSGM